MAMFTTLTTDSPQRLLRKRRARPSWTAAASVLALTCSVFIHPAAAQSPPAGASSEFKIDPASVTRFGPACKYPQAGWIVLHIEGSPYDRGYQHGKLMSREIVDTIGTLALAHSPKAPHDAWKLMRTAANALFLRQYAPEYLEEMRGIADGAASAGANYDDRPIDLVDIVTINSDIETEFLEDALRATPTGLEGKRFPEPPVGRPHRRPEDHCSAFAATGPATADGKIVFGHITMFQLMYVQHYNVWLDVKPTAGHRVAMQSFPGGIMSGLDYYMNDAGLLICETTIDQTAYEAGGAPVASRIRQAAQYADNIDRAVELLGAKNNGLYTNEWLLADTNTNEIAMFELGTAATRLWRSSRDEWVGGTKGFYWGCNNGKDMKVRAEMLPSLEGKPGNIVFHPEQRDMAWLKLFDKRAGKIDTAFGFEAFTTPPLAAFPSCDAKFTTSDMAKEMKTWAIWGPPLGKTWDATAAERKKWPDIRPLVSNDWTILTSDPPPAAVEGTLAVDLKTKLDDEADDDKPHHRRDVVEYPAAWHGTLLPATPADTWLAAAFSDYEKIVALEKSHQKAAVGKPMKQSVRDEIALVKFVPWSKWLAAERRLGRELPLSQTEFDWHSDDWYTIAAGKGTMLLAALRAELGAETFDAAMDAFGRKHAGQPVTADTFVKHCEGQAGRPLESFFAPWLTSSVSPDERSGNFWAVSSFEAERERALIVVGTLHDVQSQREAAERLQRQIARHWSNWQVPIVVDADITDEQLSTHHVLLVGTPTTNAVASRWSKRLPVTFGEGSFVVRGSTYAHPASAVIAACENPASPRYSVVIFAGLSADATWHVVAKYPNRDDPPPQTLVLPAHSHPRAFGAERFTVHTE